MGDVTAILDAIDRGDPKAAEELLPLVYEELRHLAAQKLALESPGQTLQATALVHEAYLRLVSDADLKWNSARHFFRAAAGAMRRILIDNARRKRAVRHGGLFERVNVEKIQLAAAMPSDQLLAVDEALERFAKVDPQAAELIKLRFYAGLSHQQAADTLGLSVRTADRLWAFGRAWLFRQIRGVNDPEISL
jgi:RNA polymerase sigma factor (TIGR02999 family)